MRLNRGGRDETTRNTENTEPIIIENPWVFLVVEKIKPQRSRENSKTSLRSLVLYGKKRQNTKAPKGYRLARQLVYSLCALWLRPSIGAREKMKPRGHSERKVSY